MLQSDESLLAAVPSFISIGSMLKATPSTDGGRRFLYCEASNEGLDQQNEVVAAKALAESAEYFKRYGNIDLEHYTLIGKPNPAKGWPGIPDANLYEIGRPVDVRQNGKSTFVKCEIYAGDGIAAARANEFWSSLTELQPPQRWYPSVGGAIDKSATKVVIDPTTKLRKAIVQKVRWTNIGFSKTPVNQHVPECATLPMGAFAKCFGADGFDLAKALEASYATDAAAKTGGAALGMQSLDRGQAPRNYHEFREKLAEYVRTGVVGENPGANELVSYAAKHFSLPSDQAAEWVERFVRDLKTGLNKRSKS
jgi:hypothetical protein